MCRLYYNYLYGQDFYGANKMASGYKEVQAIVRSKYPNVIYMHCAVHF